MLLRLKIILSPHFFTSGLFVGMLCIGLWSLVFWGCYALAGGGQ